MTDIIIITGAYLGLGLVVFSIVEGFHLKHGEKINASIIMVMTMICLFYPIFIALALFSKDGGSKND